MRVRNKRITAVFMVLLTTFVSGCNLFKAVDNSINNTSCADLISQGKDKIAEADYATALNRFERALEKGRSDEIYRGRGSAYAGLAGFNMFSTLNAFQNEVVAPNTSAVIFNAAKSINSLENLNKAIDDLAMLSNPTKEDLLLRATLSTLSAAKTLLVKYDTNLNSKFDYPDQINFSTNDNKTQTWPILYNEFASANSPYSIEKAYKELTVALDGRGTTWTTISPFESVTKTGTYTQANYNTIMAVGDFGKQIKVANLTFNNSVNDFKTAILALDGAN